MWQDPAGLQSPSFRAVLQVELATRQEMLRRIREALAPPQGAASVPDLSALPDLEPDLEALLPSIAPAQLLTQFEDELGKVGGSAHRVQNRSEIAELLSRIVPLADRARGAVLSRNPLLGRLELAQVLESIGISTLAWPAGLGTEAAPEAATAYRGRCFSAAIGVTGVDFALAESGTLVLTSLTEGSQLSSLAPPVHIAFYLRRQLVATLEEVLDGLPIPPAGERTAPGRSVVLVTGPSRTADIEQILIRGVHGPREVHAILVEEPGD